MRYTEADASTNARKKHQRRKGQRNEKRREYELSALGAWRARGVVYAACGGVGVTGNMSANANVTVNESVVLSVAVDVTVNVAMHVNDGMVCCWSEWMGHISSLPARISLAHHRSQQSTGEKADDEERAPAVEDALQDAARRKDGRKGKEKDSTTLLSETIDRDHLVTSHRI